MSVRKWFKRRVAATNLGKEVDDRWKQFWRVKQAHKPGRLRVRCDSPEIEDAVFEGTFSGELPIRLLWQQGRMRFDLIESNLLFPYLFSTHALDLFQEAGLKGFKRYPTSIDATKGDQGIIDKYEFMGLLGRAGPVLWRETEIVRAVIGDEIRYDVQDHFGLPFDVETWDGSDFFTTQGNAWLLASERVAQIVRDNKLTNIELLSLADFRYPYDPSDPDNKR